MPIQSSFGALTYPKGTFFSTTVGNGWISIGNPGIGYRGANAQGYGTGISLDSGGNVFVSTATGANTNDGYAMKFDANIGNNIWQLGTLRGPGIVATNSNIFIAQNFARIANGIPTYDVQCYTVTNSNLTPVTSTITYVANLTNAFNFPDFNGIRTDNANNAYSLWGFGSINSGRIYISDGNNVFRGQGALVAGTDAYYPTDITITPNGNNMYVLGTVFSTTTGVSWYVNKLSKTGNYSWTRTWCKQLSANANIGYIAADNNNVYITTTTSGIIKLDGNGNILAQKGNAGARSPITFDSTGNIYTVEPGGWVKYDANLDIILYRKIVTNIGGSGISAPIGIQINGNYVIGSYTDKSKLVTFKVPNDGTIPGVGIYRPGPYYVFYSNNTVTNSNTATTVTTVTKVTSSINPFSNTSPSVSTGSLSPGTYNQTTI